MARFTISDADSGISVSPTLYGVSIEDKNFACDGGLNANMVANYSFDEADPMGAWRCVGGSIYPGRDVRGKSDCAKVYCEEEVILTNLGYNGNGKYYDIPAMGILDGHTYIFKCDMKQIDYKGQIYVSVINKSGRNLVKSRSIPIPSDDQWHTIKLLLIASETNCGKLELKFKGKGNILLDQVMLYDQMAWGEGMSKWSCSRMRRDLVHAIGEVKPFFLRFPVVSRTDPPYNWKDYVGPLLDRRGGGTYSSQIGVYEYLCLCEDLGIEPAPMFWSSDPQDYFDFIEFAMGDPDLEQWATLRRQMGHPEPFVLKKIRVSDDSVKSAILSRFPFLYVLSSSEYFPPNDEMDDTLQIALDQAREFTEVEKHGNEKFRKAYVTLLGMAEYGHKNRSLLTYNPLSVTHSANYYVQELFSTNLGQRVAGFEGQLPFGHYMSVTRDDDVFYIKYVNTGCFEERITIECPRKVIASWGEILTADAENARGQFAEDGALAARNISSFNSSELEQVIVSDFDHKIKDNEIKFTSRAYSLMVIRAEQK